jgi:integrase
MAEDTEVGAAGPADGDGNGNYLQILEGSLSRSTTIQLRKYSAMYESFRGDRPHGEEAVLAFVMSKQDEWKASTLWTCVSLIRRYLLTECNVTTGKLERVQAFLKALGSGQRPKKAPSFTKLHIFDFLGLCPNEGQAVVDKLVVAFGYFGALRVAELVKMSFGDVQVTHVGALVTLGKTKTEHEGTQKLIPVLQDKRVCPVTAFVAYQDSVRACLGLENEMERRLFLRWNPVTKAFENRPLGKAKIADIPRHMATVLHLDNAKFYTGHSLRVTSATVLADSGASLTNLKRHGRWRSSTVAEGYVRDSLLQKKKAAAMLCGTPLMTSQQHSKAKGHEYGGFVNCSFHFHGSGAVHVGDEVGDGGMELELEGQKLDKQKECERRIESDDEE